jgi:hypothetical protein
MPADLSDKRDAPLWKLQCPYKFTSRIEGTESLIEAGLFVSV